MNGKNNFVNFPMIAEIVSGDEGITIASEIINHSQQLTPLRSIFLQMEASTQIRNGYWIHFFLTSTVEMTASSHTHMQIKKLTLKWFWFTLLKTFPCLVKAALQFLMPFVSTYQSEVGLSSTLVHTKTKARNSPNVTNNICVALSKKKKKHKENK